MAGSPASLSSIHQLVKRNNRQAVSKMLETRKDQINKKDTIEQTPLHIAAFEGFVDMVVLLLVHGANVNATDRNKWTPLHCAASSGQLQIMEILLDQGANVAAANNEGSTAAHYMVRHGLPKSDKPLFRRVMTLLLEKMSDTNQQNTHGETPLHQACFRGRKLSVKLLLKHKANPNLRTKFGETGLHFAARKGELITVRLLLAHGADPFVKGDMGTARDVAAACRHKALVELFDSLMPPGALAVKKLSSAHASGGSGALGVISSALGVATAAAAAGNSNSAPAAASRASSPPDVVSRPASAMSLSPALMSRIFSYLDVNDMARVSRVCRRWQKAAKDQELWRSLYTSHIGRVRSKYEVAVNDWRETYHGAAAVLRSKGGFRALTGHTGRLASVYIDERAGRIVSAAAEIKVWDAQTLQCVTTINRGGPYNCVHLDEHRVACAAEDKTVKLWDLRSSQIIRTLLGHDAPVQRVQTEGERLVSSGADGRLLLWDLASGQQVRAFSVERAQYAIRSFYFERDRLAAGLVANKDAGTHQLHLWNLRTGVLARSLSKMCAVSVSFNRDWLIGARSNRVKVWDMRSGHCERTLRLEPKAPVQCCQRYGDTLATGDDAGNLRIFDVTTGVCWRTLQAHRDRVVALHFSGRLIATAGADGMVKLLEMIDKSE